MSSKTSGEDGREPSLVGPGERFDRVLAELGDLMLEAAKLPLLSQGPQILVVIDAWIPGQ
jgi:hypothetical protein